MLDEPTEFQSDQLNEISLEVPGLLSLVVNDTYLT